MVETNGSKLVHTNFMNLICNKVGSDRFAGVYSRSNHGHE